MYETTVVFKIGRHRCEPIERLPFFQPSAQKAWKESLEEEVALRNLELPADQQISLTFQHHIDGSHVRKRLTVEEVIGLIEARRTALFGTPVTTGP